MSNNAKKKARAASWKRKQSAKTEGVDAIARAVGMETMHEFLKGTNTGRQPVGILSR